MQIEFKKISEFNRGILFELLKDAYSFNTKWENYFKDSWKEFDDFFFDNLEIADKYGFITTLNDKPIGLASWDPRNMPQYAEIGHNCIITKYKGNGYGKMQLAEAVKRISQNYCKKIIVTTNGNLIPAQKNYESVGFKLSNRKENKTDTRFSGDYIYYEYIL